MAERIKTQRVDFHVHYNDEKARQILSSARAENITAVGFIRRTEISDYIDDYMSYGKQLGVAVYPGVEYFARLGNSNIDLIALGFDSQAASIREVFGVAERKTFNRQLALRQKDLFEKQGFNFEGLQSDKQIILENLLSGEISEKAITFCQLATYAPANRPLIEGLKRQKADEWSVVLDHTNRKPGYDGNLNAQEAKFIWTLYFSPGSPCFIPIQIGAEEMIQRAHRAGGVVLYSPEGKYDAVQWKKLLSMDVDGIMAWHGGELDLSRELIRDIRNRGLLILGGSDYDPNVREWMIGSGNGAMFISPRRELELIQRLRIYDKENSLA